MIGQAEVILNRNDVDFSLIVGREIKLVTEQFPGRALSTRVIAVKEDSLVIDRSGSGGLVNQLICRQNVEVHFNYKDQPMVFFSTVNIPREGKIEIPIAVDLSPKVRRKFVRYDFIKEIRMTYCDMTQFKDARLNKLKWLETNVINLGGGGMLLELPTVLSRDNFIIFNLEMDDFPLPKLMIGRVRHSRSERNTGMRAGIEFILKEERQAVLPPTVSKNLSEQLFNFDSQMRLELARHLEENYRKSIA